MVPAGMAEGAMDVARFFRVHPAEGKFSSIRPLGYTLLGYAVAPIAPVSGIVLNTLAIAGVLMFAYSLNDYYDHFIGGERNSVGNAIARGRLSAAKALGLCCAPLLLLPVLLFGVPPVSFVLALALALLCLVYSLPGVALKHTAAQFAAAPLSAGLLFVQAFLVSGALDAAVLCLLCLVVLNHFVLESLHCLHDAVVEGTYGRKEAFAARVLRCLPWASAVVSAAFAFVHPVFLVGLAFSLIRVVCLRGFDPRGAHFRRLRNVFHPVLPTYEYLAYAAVGLLGGFG